MGARGHSKSGDAVKLAGDWHTSRVNAAPRDDRQADGDMESATGVAVSLIACRLLEELIGDGVLAAPAIPVTSATHWRSTIDAPWHHAAVKLVSRRVPAQEGGM